MKTGIYIQLEKLDYVRANKALDTALDNERESSIPFRSDLKHELAIALEAVAEKAFKLGMENTK